MLKVSIILFFLILTSVDVDLVKLRKPVKNFITEFKTQLANTNEAKKQNSTTLSSATSTARPNSSTSTSLNVINLDYSEVSFRIYNQLVYGKSNIKKELVKLFEDDSFFFIKGESTFVSPFGLINSLVVCYFGAQNETANQLRQFLRLGNLTNSQIRELFSKRITNTRLSQANRIFVDDNIPINSNFKNIITKEFQGIF